MKTWLLFITTILSLQFSGQVVVKGSVRSAKDSTAIQDAVITDRHHSALSDSSGHFKFTADSLPVNLEVLYPGFKRAEITIHKNGYFKIYLEELTIEQPTVVITDEAIKRIAGNRKRSIWDYGWNNDVLFICEFGQHLQDGQLIALNQAGDTLSKLAFPDKPRDLFRACTGEFFLQCQNAAYPVIFENNQLSWGAATDNNYLDKIMRNCTSADSTNLYFTFPAGQTKYIDNNTGGYNFMTRYDEMNVFFFKRKEEKMIFVFKIVDRLAKELKAEEVYFSKFKTFSHTPGVDKLFFYRFMCKEVYSPLFSIRDTVYLLDYVNEKIAAFNQSGEVYWSQPFRQTDNKKLKRFSFHSDDNEHIYITYEVGALTAIEEILPSNGQTVYRWTLPIPFPEKITEHDGSFYFLHRDNFQKDARLLSRFAIR
jgi:hypothetical protein